MDKIAEAIIIIIVGIIILGRAIYIIVANRRRYSLRVKAKCVGYETAVEQIDKTISENQHNLDKIIEQNALKKEVGKLRGAVYEAEINGKKSSCVANQILRFRPLKMRYLWAES